MNRPDREDATARALDILPSGDPAASDPRLVRDATLAEEARATREAAADVWLAVSPLRAAPPEVLSSVMDKIGLPPAAEKPARKGAKLAPLLAASGWAAAAAVTLCLWPYHGGEASSSQMAENTPKAPPTKASVRGSADSSGEAGLVSADPRMERLRRDYANLQKTVEMLRQNQLGQLPRVFSLMVPGAVRRTPDEARQQMFQMVAGALRDNLEVQSSQPGAPPSLALTSGYLPSGVDFNDAGIELRHRNFPENAWWEYGLQRSEEGNAYYDPARHLLWTQDTLVGGFIGRKVAEGDVDLAAFKQATKDEIAKADPPRSDPEGFVIEDPVTRKAEVVIDKVQPPRAGHEHRIVWTDASGGTGSVLVQNAATTSVTGAGNSAIYYTSNGRLYAVGGSPVVLDPSTFLTPPGTDGLWNLGTATVMASFSASDSVTSFELQEVPITVAGQTTVTKPRIIVQGGD